jgi:hypothetical protein
MPCQQLLSYLTADVYLHICVPLCCAVCFVAKGLLDRGFLEDTSSFRFGYICRAWLMGAISLEVHGEEPSWNQQMKELHLAQ